MKNTIKLVSVLVVIILVSVISLIVQDNKQSQSNVNVEVKEKSEQEKVEEFAEKMKPKIEEELREMDIHGFINSITFEKNVTISPMGYITVDGYINDEPEKFHFSASLMYRTNEIASMSFSAELGDRFENWADFDPQVKEDFLNSLSKKEREQYLKDIGEKE
ncbi:DUF1433 domain-containing protein [Bacillus safensis]|uniref:DUF1433 domain-containing protein n=1 Tax=Bacillus safensis TaxID=561879 RepID=UPI00203BA527|nr:DUF1433 domain-containing protein [Bacillus safensis]MCM2989194.1 DUF1433 domain-containing protein [Bacillus safensis]MCM2989195.1 DUF1433 domain-containing protein [Bacillus safensis]